MKIGEKVRLFNRPEFGVGEISKIHEDGNLDLVFPSCTVTWVEVDRVVSVEKELLAKKRRFLKHEILELLSSGNLEEADSLYNSKCKEWWDHKEFVDIRTKEVEKLLHEERNNLKNKVIELMGSGNFKEADSLYNSKCKDWWDHKNFADVKKKEEQEILRDEICSLFDLVKFDEADDHFEKHCTDWWKKKEYKAGRAKYKFIQKFVKTYSFGTLSELDALYHNYSGETYLTAEDFVSLKLPKLRSLANKLELDLDNEQLRANARPEHKLLIKARAGSGKTRTLCARAAIAIQDEKLDPNQVLILAFNKAAAAEVEKRISKWVGNQSYSNARTFHSLEYQLIQPKKQLLFDAGGEPSQSDLSRFVQRRLERILNPAFKEKMVEFFRQELEQIEGIGRDLDPENYLIFRRAFELFTLGGQRVKSNGEKFIADFLFEHGIEYRYERAWAWKASFLDGTTYKPDFSLLVGGRDYILEHWGIDPEGQNSRLPKHWDISAAEYKKQALDKRKFWKEKEILLLETHTGMMGVGREEFEGKLKEVLENAGIECHRLPHDQIVNKVFENDFTISRMAKLFVQFIQRAKKRGWSADDASEKIRIAPANEARTKLFYELALRVYREYEKALEEQSGMDFDDLLMDATEEVNKNGAQAKIHLGQGNLIHIDRLKWILVDEYQDFSELFYQLLKAILRANPNIKLVAVGDDWQAINSFAGAELRFFTNVDDYFSGALPVNISTNYRSSRTLVEAGNKLMQGFGASANFIKPSAGTIKVCCLNDAWIEFRQDTKRSSDKKSDALFLPKELRDRGPSERELRQAQALKLCSEDILKNPIGNIMLLARTNYVYGIKLNEFRSKLVNVLTHLEDDSSWNWGEKISAFTAHSSKGQEADTVIILDATQKQFPKIHPDNLLYELFGVSPKSVLEEERRLFYVAISRAENRLLILTDEGLETPYLKQIKGDPFLTDVERQEETIHQLLPGSVAEKIQAKIKRTVSVVI